MSRQRQDAAVMTSSLENCLPRNTDAVMVGIRHQIAALIKLTKPGIVLTEVLAGLAGMLLVAPEQTIKSVFVPTLLSIALTAGGAAMLNCLLEATHDRQMTRLASRCRALESADPGRVLFIALAMIVAGLSLAFLTAPPLVLLLLTFACLSYLLLYTMWLKRRSPWGVLAGCIPGALPPLIGAAAVSSAMTTAPLLLASLIFIWQLPHFWFLALEYRDQYVKAGIQVLPVAHGEALTRVLILSAALLLLPNTLAIGFCSGLSPLFFILTSAGGVIFFLYCMRCLYQIQSYRHGFRASLCYLMLVIIAICLDKLPALPSYNQW